MIIEIRKLSSVFANKTGLVRINVNISVPKGIGVVMLRATDIKFILIRRVCVLLVESFFKVFYINTSLNLLRGLLKRGNI